MVEVTLFLQLGGSCKKQIPGIVNPFGSTKFLDVPFKIVKFPNYPPLLLDTPILT